MPDYVPAYDSEDQLIALSMCGDDGLTEVRGIYLVSGKQEVWGKTLTDKKLREPCSVGKIPVVELRVFAVKSLQLCPTVQASVDCNLPDISVDWARVLEWSA